MIMLVVAVQVMMMMGDVMVLATVAVLIFSCIEYQHSSVPSSMHLQKSCTHPENVRKKVTEATGACFSTAFFRFTGAWGT